MAGIFLGFGAIATMLLYSMIFINPVFAATLRCRPMNVLGECMSPTDDRIRVPSIDVLYLDENDRRIKTTLRNVVTTSSEATYIIQVIDEQNRTIYLNWTNLIVPSGHAVFVSDHLHNFENGIYTVKVLVWTPIEGEGIMPLLMEPKIRPLVIGHQGSE